MTKQTWSILPIGYLARRDALRFPALRTESEIERENVMSQSLTQKPQNFLPLLALGLMLALAVAGVVAEPWLQSFGLSREVSHGIAGMPCIAAGLVTGRLMRRRHRHQGQK